MLGLIREDGGAAAKALESLKISLTDVRDQVHTILSAGEDRQGASGSIPFTSHAKTALAFSLTEAQSLGHDYIDTEHILLGLVREGDGVAVQVLVELGAEPNMVRQQLIRILTGYREDDGDGED